METIDDVVFNGASRCEKAEPAADFDALLELMLYKILDAAIAASLYISDFPFIFRYLQKTPKSYYPYVAEARLEISVHPQAHLWPCKATIRPPTR